MERRFLLHPPPPLAQHNTAHRFVYAATKLGGRMSMTDGAGTTQMRLYRTLFTLFSRELCQKRKGKAGKENGRGFAAHKLLVERESTGNHGLTG